jgi:hypothetical protein
MWTKCSDLFLTLTLLTVTSKYLVANELILILTSCAADAICVMSVEYRVVIKLVA